MPGKQNAVEIAHIVAAAAVPAMLKAEKRYQKIKTISENKNDITNKNGVSLKFILQPLWKVKFSQGFLYFTFNLHKDGFGFYIRILFFKRINIIAQMKLMKT